MHAGELCIGDVGDEGDHVDRRAACKHRWGDGEHVGPAVQLMMDVLKGCDLWVSV